MKKKISMAILSIVLISAIFNSTSIEVKAFGFDTHFYLKYFLLCKMNFTAEDAMTIAVADVSVDEGDTVADLDSPNNKDWHALGNVLENQARQEVLLNRAMDKVNKFKQTKDPEDKKLALIYFGQYLHFLEDNYSHQGRSTVIGGIDVGHAIPWVHTVDYLSYFSDDVIQAMVNECLNATGVFLLAMGGKPPDILWLDPIYGFCDDLKSAHPSPKLWPSPSTQNPKEAKDLTEKALGLPWCNLTLPELYKYDRNGNEVGFIPVGKFVLTEDKCLGYASVIYDIIGIIENSPWFENYPDARVAVELLYQFIDEMKYPDFPIDSLGYAISNLTGLSYEDREVLDGSIVLSLMIENLLSMRDFHITYIGSRNHVTYRADFSAALSEAYDEMENACLEIQKMDINPYSVDYHYLVERLAGAWTYLRKAEQIALTVDGVGGIVVPVDKFILIAPYIALASTILGATVIYFKLAKRRKEQQ